MFNRGFEPIPLKQSNQATGLRATLLFKMTSRGELWLYWSQLMTRGEFDSAVITPSSLLPICMLISVRFTDVYIIFSLCLISQHANEINTTSCNDNNIAPLNLLTACRELPLQLLEVNYFTKASIIFCKTYKYIYVCNFLNLPDIVLMWK